MRILVTYPLNPQLVEPGLGDAVVYRPDLAGQSEEVLRHALAQYLPDAMVVNGNCPGTATLANWHRVTQKRVQLIHHRSEKAQQAVHLPNIDVHQTSSASNPLPEGLEALALAERQVMREVTARRLAAHGISAQASGTLDGSRVLMIGAGIVNLMIAVRLAERGARVEILDARPDPRSHPAWQRLGTTHGGSNARMFCFTEANNYHSKETACAARQQVFRQTISNDGWLAVDPETLDRHGRTWIERFHGLPRWRAEVFTEDIHGFTISSDPLWQELRRTRPQLFEDVGYTPGILQLYAEAGKAATAEALHAKIGSLIRVLDSDELVRRHPACRDAVMDGQIAGALEIRGFTLNVHDFVARLLSHLEAHGVRLHWEKPVSEIEWTADGQVCGLVTRDGIQRSEHYVLSPGAYGGSLLDGTRSAGKIQGIVGLWTSLPNPEPYLRRSIKLHREGQVGEDSNLILGRDAAGRPSLMLGSGYGFLGSRKLDMNSPEMTQLFAALEITARRYFPRAYEQAVSGGMLHRSRRACVRPFTCTGLGVFEVHSTSDGGRLVIASGHNTGGFAQAPAVAEAVEATLSGQAHPMQALYDPERGIPSDASMD